MATKPYSIAVAGTTAQTLWCAQALAADPRFSIDLVITPTPKPIGRHHTLTPNPLHQWAIDQSLTTLLITQKLSQLEPEILTHSVDFLLVVDFGYLISDQILAWPRLVPLNIHPSALPAYRGAAPGQFVLLNGEPTSAVTLMIPNHLLDQGDILAQLDFTVDQTWTQQDYYDFSFQLITPQLGNLIDRFANGQLPRQPQPLLSPTPTASQVSKQDLFVNWQTVHQVLDNQTLPGILETSPEPKITAALTAHHGDLIQRQLQHQPASLVIERAIRAFAGWPGVWTMVNTPHGLKRLKLLQAHLDSSDQKLVLDRIQLEGRAPINL